MKDAIFNIGSGGVVAFLFSATRPVTYEIRPQVAVVVVVVCIWRPHLHAQSVKDSHPEEEDH